ncbi:NACHT domain-containing protein [Urbifossiella limnaea]|uniref:NACHT domain-containing protein n=1 Tax=Urbifossiella limnaea TaxID=2528023 RepID=UPI0011A3016C|nr:hypothetical protein [Urbifossiella limnaea]
MLCQQILTEFARLGYAIADTVLEGDFCIVCGEKQAAFGQVERVVGIGLGPLGRSAAIRSKTIKDVGKAVGRKKGIVHVIILLSSNELKLSKSDLLVISRATSCGNISTVQAGKNLGQSPVAVTEGDKGEALAYSDAAQSLLDNATLMDALTHTSSRRIDSFYTDIDFALGTRAHRFLEGNIKSGRAVLELQQPEWHHLRGVDASVYQLIGVHVIEGDSDRIENNYQGEVDEQSRIQKEIKRAHSEVLGLRLECARLLQELKLAAKATEEPGQELAKVKFTNLVDAIVLAVNQQDWHLIGSDGKSLRLADKDKILMKDVALLASMPEDGLIDVATNYVAKSGRRREVEAQLKGYREAVVAPIISVTVETAPLVEHILVGREALRRRIEAFNTRPPQHDELSSFLRDFHHFTRGVMVALSHEIISSKVAIEASPTYSYYDRPYRLSLSIHEVLKTGSNLVVYGEAGAGKTTSLQMYATKQLANYVLGRRFALYIPLNRLLHAWKEREELSRDTGPVPVLESGVKCFLASLASDLTAVHLDALFSSGSVSLLFDGIDEVIKVAPWIVDAIVQFSRKYPAVQVVASSRVSDASLSKNGWLEITLLPFTDEQRDQFFLLWFGGDPHNRVKDITAHLQAHRKVAAIVRNPLLATALCVLAEKNIPLPNSEIRLYEERFRLLLGHYDSHKQVSRITTHHRDLETVARSIAHEMHERTRRYMSKEAMYKIAEDAIASYHHGKNAREMAATAVDELIDPCNILVPMTAAGEWGFGHLRYQEYLVAVELNSARSRRVGDHIGEPWWHDVYVLFAQLAGDLEWLITYLTAQGRLTRGLRTITAMVQQQPPAVRQRMQQLISRNRRTDGKFADLLANDAATDAAGIEEEMDYYR